MEPSPSAPPPPTSVSQDEHDAVDSARQRFTRKSRFPRFLSLPSLKPSHITPQSDHPSTSSTVHLPPSDPQDPIVSDVGVISLDPSGIDDQEEYKDKYEWAIVYENQRGMTIFSIPYYSRLSLLPSDPSPFTTPNSSPNSSTQPPISLADYPLPDGNWRWVSKCWMIDMRSDSGEVQHDGFEYNWVFRTHKWHAEVGPLSAGAWVRRRRWVRLMMRPAKKNRRKHGDNLGYSPVAESSLPHSRDSDSVSPSVNLSRSGRSTNSPDVDDIWSSNDVELNWKLCHIIMKQLGRDGRRLELWKRWLRQNHDNILKSDHKGKGRNIDGKSISETQNGLNSSESLAQLRCPPREYLIPVLRRYGDSLLSSFVYPDSRAELLNDLGLAGLLPELNIGLGRVDFWSYTAGELGEQV